METQEKEALTKRLLAHIDNNTTDYADEVMVVPFKAFADPELHAREVVAARRNPHIVAHGSQLPKPGDFVTTDLIGVPVLVVRQKDGSVKAFSNTCRHRGARVEHAQFGCKRIFTCMYHNWAYGTEGDLRALPHAGDFDGMDKSERGLLEFPCQEQYGLIWVVPTHGAGIDIEGIVGAKHHAELEATGMTSAYQYRVHTWDLPINWKVLVDGVQDTYHLCQLHTTTVCPLLVGNVHAIDRHGKSWRLVVARKSIEDIRHADPEEVDVRNYTLTNYTIYPGTMLVTEPAHFEIWSITPHPTDPTLGRITIRLLSPSQPDSDKARKFFDLNWDLLMKTLIDEDWMITKTITDNRDGGVPDLIYGRNELGCQMFHTTLAEDVATITRPGLAG